MQRKQDNLQCWKIQDQDLFTIISQSKLEDEIMSPLMKDTIELKLERKNTKAHSYAQRYNSNFVGQRQNVQLIENCQQFPRINLFQKYYKNQPHQSNSYIQNKLRSKSLKDKTQHFQESTQNLNQEDLSRQNSCKIKLQSLYQKQLKLQNLNKKIKKEQVSLKQLRTREFLSKSQELNNLSYKVDQQERVVQYQIHELITMMKHQNSSPMFNQALSQGCSPINCNQSFALQVKKSENLVQELLIKNLNIIIYISFVLICAIILRFLKFI